MVGRHQPVLEERHRQAPCHPADQLGVGSLGIDHPAGGKHACKVTQTINGKRLDNGTTYPTLEEAARGGLDDLRKAMGW